MTAFIVACDDEGGAGGTSSSAQSSSSAAAGTGGEQNVGGAGGGNTGGAGGNDGGAGPVGSGGTGGAGGAGGGGGVGGAGGDGGTGGSGGGSNACTLGTSASGVRADILLVVDNSRSMADKQQILSMAIDDLVGSLTNPPCVDGMGNPAPQQPSSGLDACPVGTSRAYAPTTDMHIGVISTSLGGHGADACPNQENNTCAPDPNLTNNDKGHLLTRNDPCTNAQVATYQGKGFLAWDPEAKLMPPGDADPAAYAGKLKELVEGAGQVGCGYESQLESFYRFLVDPEPYQTISVVNGQAVPAGTDQVLLTQRADFLRPDSLLGIFVISDENDCSTKEYGQFFYANQLKAPNATPFHLPRPRAECAANPNDPCCLSCGQNPGNCPVDPSCFDANNNVKALTALEDQSNLRCFEQKRRFGIDFLYPIDRYVTGLTSPVVPKRNGDLVPNPIYSDLNPNDALANIRCPEHVFLTGIVGVPWQSIARQGDLSQGFMDAAELSMGNPSGWDTILGDPAQYIQAADAHMIESIAPRAGLAPPGSPSGTDPIHGHEYTIQNFDDLQYACIFPLLAARDCTDPNLLSCDCKDSMNDNPLCEPDPVDPSKRTLQVRAKAYPGLRHLSLLKELGNQGVVASICPAELADSTSLTFAYRPAVRAFIERTKPIMAIP
jgi:hypothetical protein